MKSSHHSGTFVIRRATNRNDKASDAAVNVTATAAYRLGCHDETSVFAVPAWLCWYLLVILSLIVVWKTKTQEKSKKHSRVAGHLYFIYI